MNLKFPRGHPKPPIQRNSFFSLGDQGQLSLRRNNDQYPQIPSHLKGDVNMMHNRPPPGFEGIKSSQSMMPASNLPNKSQYLPSKLGGMGGPMEYLDPLAGQRKPKSKRSCQNIIQPLVSDTDFKLNLYIDKVGSYIHNLALESE